MRREISVLVRRNESVPDIPGSTDVVTSHRFCDISAFRDVILISLQIGRKKAMKVSLLLLAAVLSITAANAGPHKPAAEAAVEPVNRCNVNLWPGFSATPCKAPPGVTNYNDCSNLVRKIGGNDREVWWYCSSIHFKS